MNHGMIEDKSDEKLVIFETSVRRRAEVSKIAAERTAVDKCPPKTRSGSGWEGDPSPFFSPL